MRGCPKLRIDIRNHIHQVQQQFVGTETKAFFRTVVRSTGPGCLSCDFNFKLINVAFYSFSVLLFLNLFCICQLVSWSRFYSIKQKFTRHGYFCILAFVFKNIVWQYLISLFSISHISPYSTLNNCVLQSNIDEQPLSLEDCTPTQMVE